MESKDKNINVDVIEAGIWLGAGTDKQSYVPLHSRSWSLTAVLLQLFTLSFTGGQTNPAVTTNK